jgi:hypothetical protein
MSLDDFEPVLFQRHQSIPWGEKPPGVVVTVKIPIA